jgi:hypothetical protein
MGDFVEVFESHNRKGGGVEAVRAGIVGGRGKYVFRTGEAGRKHRVENRQQYDVHRSTFRSIGHSETYPPGNPMLSRRAPRTRIPLH